MKVTKTDLALARAFYPILVEQAAAKRTITYGGLVEAAKARSPDDPIISKAIAISAGRRLDVVRLFTDARDLPDLSSLVVNGDTGEVGAAYSAMFDAPANREKVFSYDWVAAFPDFELHVEAIETALPKSIKRTSRDAAKILMADFVAQNRGRLTADAAKARDRILELLCDGRDPEAAFAEAGALKPAIPADGK